MADVNLTQEEFLTYEGLGYFKGKQDAVNDAKDAKVLQDAQKYADDLSVNYDAAGTAQTKVDALANGAVKDNADAISGLTENKADKTQVATDIENAVKAENEARVEAVQAVQDEVDALEQTHATDKAALEASIKGITDDYLKASDKTELQGNINTVNAAVERLTNGVSADEVDGVNDLIQYVKDHGTEVTGMQEGIADNAEAIEAVAGRATTLETDMTQAKTDIDAVEAAVATKVEQEAYNTKVTALEGEDTAMKARLDALEEAVGGDGAVGEQIDAKIADLDATVASTDVEEGKGLKVTTVQTDGKLVSVAVEGNFDNSYDVKGSAATAKSEAISAAAEDATTKANQAEANAKAEVTALADGAVADNTQAIADIQAAMPTAITNAQIDTLFATE